MGSAYVKRSASGGLLFGPQVPDFKDSKALGLQLGGRVSVMETDSICWVCSLPFLPRERMSRLSSLGFDVHARCADKVLRDEPPPPLDEPSFDEE
jgi:hypothetical protein